MHRPSRIMYMTFSLSKKFLITLLLFFHIPATFAGDAPAKKESPVVRFAVIADVHKGLQKDAEARLEAFVKEATQQKVDFIVQLGDLSHGQGIEAMTAIWDKFPGDRYHVLGNHDTDRNSKKNVLALQKMPANYYSFEKGDYHFIVLDAVSKQEKDRMGETQLEWLENEIKNSTKPCIIFSHAGFDDAWDKDTAIDKPAVRKIVNDANNRASGKAGKKVIAFFSGHHHLDEYTQIKGIHYFQINSASYYWIAGSTSFSNGNMAEYKDPLYAIVTLDPGKKALTLTGKKSSFLPPAPTKKTFKNAHKIAPKISDRKINY